MSLVYVGSGVLSVGKTSSFSKYLVESDKHSIPVNSPLHDSRVHPFAVFTEFRCVSFNPPPKRSWNSSCNEHFCPVLNFHHFAAMKRDIVLTRCSRLVFNRTGCDERQSTFARQSEPLASPIEPPLNPALTCSNLSSGRCVKRETCRMAVRLPSKVGRIRRTF